jgi:hypothetical protein
MTCIHLCTSPFQVARVSLVEKDNADMNPGVDSPAIVDVVSMPTGVDMGGPQADSPQIDAVFVLSLIWHWMMVSKHMH